MANTISTNPWRIDTLPFSYPYRTKLTGVQWTDQTSAGDHLVVTDTNGNTIIDSRAQTPNYQQSFLNILWVDGFVVTVLDSGVLSVAVGAGR